MITKRNKILFGEGVKPILYDLYLVDSPDPKPLIIFCHGYKGFKDWGAWNLVAESFVNAGFNFLKFNFSHNGGTMTQPIDFPDLEAFALNNFSTELNDLDRVLNFVTENLKSDGISLIGHSRGGGIALIKAQEDKRIKNVITWASVCDFEARFQLGTESFEQWKKTGITHIENSRTKQQLPHYFQFYKDFKRNEKRLNIKRAVQNLKKPQLIVHGEKDPTASIKEAKALHKWNPESVLKIIESGDHVFGSSHPWHGKTLPNDLKKVTNLTVEFLIKLN
jgi:pimeloyl-ACP methyl ester carboxylesterase